MIISYYKLHYTFQWAIILNANLDLLDNDIMIYFYGLITIKKRVSTQKPSIFT